MIMPETPFIPSPISVVRMGLREACVGEGDVLIDLGSGDGRVVVEAALMGARAIGVEIDPILVEVSREVIAEKGLTGRAFIYHGDFYNTSLNAVTVVYQYLYPSISKILSEKYEKELPLGARVIALDLPIPDWLPVKIRRRLDESGILRSVFLYVIGISNPSSWIINSRQVIPSLIAMNMGLLNCKSRDTKP